MKAETHPDYHFIKVVMTDGTEYVTRSTYGKAGDKLNLDIDPKTHPAWTGGSQTLLDRGGRLSKFNSRFAGLTFGKK
ncbi:MAG: 50S ribosomal protein L31 [Proteobacteria bacterium]|nr:50S ribosomal protein L31 [Pseudomonadota bacterium]